MVLGRRSAQVLICFVLVCLFYQSSARELYGGSSEKSERPAPAPASASVQLNSTNFDELVLKSKDIWMVDFFAPWCKFSNELAPKWEKAANMLKGKVKLGHVDCQAEQSLAKRFHVYGFPSIRVFSVDKDSPFSYEGSSDSSSNHEERRSPSGIESFALEHLKNPLTHGRRERYISSLGQVNPLAFLPKDAFVKPGQEDVLLAGRMFELVQ